MSSETLTGTQGDEVSTSLEMMTARWREATEASAKAWDKVDRLEKLLAEANGKLSVIGAAIKSDAAPALRHENRVYKSDLGRLGPIPAIWVAACCRV